MAFPCRSCRHRRRARYRWQSTALARWRGGGSGSAGGETSIGRKSICRRAKATRRTSERAETLRSPATNGAAQTLIDGGRRRARWRASRDIPRGLLRRPVRPCGSGGSRALPAARAGGAGRRAPGRSSRSASPARRKSASSRAAGAARTSRCSKSSTTTCRSWSTRCVGELTERGLDIRLVVHPVLTVERDEAGRAHRASTARRTRRAAGAKASSTSTSSGIDDAAARADIVRSAREQVLAEVRVCVQDWRPMLARVERGHRRTEGQSAAAAGRRDRRGDPVPANGSPPTISRCSACATTPASPSERRARAGVRDRPRPAALAATCGCCAAATELVTDHAGDPRVPQRAEAAHRDQGRTCARACTGASISTTSASSASTATARSSASSRIVRPVHLDRLYALGARDSLPAPQGRRVLDARRLRSGRPFRQGAGQRAGDLSARRAVPDRRGHALPVRAGDPAARRAAARARAAAARSLRPLRLRARLRAARALRQPRSRRRSATISPTAFHGRVAPSIRSFRKARWCASTSSSAATRATTPNVDRATLEHAVEAIVRSWTDGLERRACRRARAEAGARAVRALSRRLPDRLSRGLSAGAAVADIAIIEALTPDIRSASTSTATAGEQANCAGLKVWSHEPADPALRARAGAGKHGLSRRRRAHLSDHGRRARRMMLVPRHDARKRVVAGRSTSTALKNALEGRASSR